MKTCKGCPAFYFY